MTSSSDPIHEMYSEGMEHTLRAGQILDDLGHMRSSLLLAFQHDEASEFAALHDHPTKVHINDIERAIASAHSIVDNEILTSELSATER
ncbi:MAG TPA: hypothetical protein EYH12_00985 [Psychromonas hadalis]|nr:hypothetical protein [Psychromonas hadalis]